MHISLSQLLSVALALVIVYYVLGLVVSAITKYILEISNTRGKVLENFLKLHLLGIAEAGQEGLLERIKKIPQVSSLRPVRYTHFGFGFFMGKTEMVDVIERIQAKTLVDALFDLSGTIDKGRGKALAVVDLLPDQLPGFNGPVDFAAKQNLIRYVEEQFSDIKEFRKKLETWFDGLLEQASQEFKAQARRIVVLLSVIVTLAFGVDSIELARMYWNNAAIAATADAQARLILSSANDDGSRREDMQELVNQLEAMQAINFGWYARPEDSPDSWWIYKVLGLLLTMFAVSQGSSFWYDILKKFKGEQSTHPVPIPEKMPSPEWSVDSVNINWHH